MVYTQITFEIVNSVCLDGSESISDAKNSNEDEFRRRARITQITKMVLWKPTSQQTTGIYKLNHLVSLEFNGCSYRDQIFLIRISRCLQIMQYVNELNSLESRRGRKPLDVNNVVYWFKNARAAQKRTEGRNVSNGTYIKETFRHDTFALHSYIYYPTNTASTLRVLLLRRRRRE